MIHILPSRPTLDPLRPLRSPSPRHDLPYPFIPPYRTPLRLASPDGTAQRDSVTGGIYRDNKQGGGLRREAWTGAPPCCCTNQRSGSVPSSYGSGPFCMCPDGTGAWTGGAYSNLLVTVTGGLDCSGWARSWATGYSPLDFCFRNFYAAIGNFFVPYISNGSVAGTACATKTGDLAGLCCWQTPAFGSFQIDWIGLTSWDAQDWWKRANPKGGPCPSPHGLPTCDGCQVPGGYYASSFQKVVVGICSGIDTSQFPGSGLFLQACVYAQSYSIDPVSCNPVLTSNLSGLFCTPSFQLKCGGSNTSSFSIPTGGAYPLTFGQWPATCKGSTTFVPCNLTGTITITDGGC